MPFAEQCRYPSQDLDAADPADPLIRIREMMPDISFAEGAEEGVCDRVTDNVGVGVAIQSAIVRNLNASKDQLASSRQPVRIVTVPAANRTHSFKSTTPFDATMLYLSFMSVRGFMSTVPPAISTRIQPAAISQRLMPCSM